jgi:methylase of polypeptide subunit release factors
VNRQDTAASVTHLARLVRNAQNLPAELRVLDLCTGTGCIPLLFRHEFTSRRKDVDLRIVGVDISDKSMSLARYNLRKIEKSTQAKHGMITFTKADVLADPFADQIAGAPLPLQTVLNHKRWVPFWDILISNPPYISPSAYWKTTTRSVRGFEPKLALVPVTKSKLDDIQQGDMFYPPLLKIARQVEAKIVLLEVADLEQALRVAQHAREMDIFEGIEIWRDEPDVSSSQPTTENGFLVQGEGNARSVVCWRGAGGSWLGRNSTTKTSEPDLHAEVDRDYIPYHY